MQKELELWQFVATRLEQNQKVMLLVVAESSGSSPGRRGYKMAVAEDGELIGSIGGGVMEVNLVEQSRELLSRSPHESSAGTSDAEVKVQVHRQNVPNSSGMICSGKQTVIFKLLSSRDLQAVRSAIESVTAHRRDVISISRETFGHSPTNEATPDREAAFETTSESDFVYREQLGPKNDLFIIGGGHCALALS